MKKAVALQYKGEYDVAPRIVAKGQGKIAERIIAIAENAEVPIYKDPALVELLSQLEINKEIPSELYQTVAEILAFVYKLEKKWGSL